MSNSKSPKSKNTRSRTAQAWCDKKRKDGTIKQFNVTLSDSVAMVAVSELPSKVKFLTNVLNLYKNGLIDKEGKLI